MERGGGRAAAEVPAAAGEGGGEASAGVPVHCDAAVPEGEPPGLAEVVHVAKIQGEVAFHVQG